MTRCGRTGRLGAAALVVGLASCDQRAADTIGHEAGVPRPGVQAQAVDRDPCAWLPRTQVEQVLGPLAAAPTPAFSAERPDPEDGGKACLYRVADESVGDVAVQVDMKDATIFEAGSGIAKDALSGDLGPKADDATPRASPDAGWDFVGGLPGMYVGRVGHVAVLVGYGSMTAPADRIAGLAARVRDQVPDLPATAPGADPNAPGSDPDPRGLLTRAEAEDVLGPLATPPYRSRASTPLADGRGESCSYYRGRHRVLVLTPTWSDGRAVFGMAAGLSQRVASTLGGGGAAGTLDGPWDQAGSGIAGELYFLKEDRMLEVQYRIAGMDEAAAVRLAATAVQRL